MMLTLRYEPMRVIDDDSIALGSDQTPVAIRIWRNEVRLRDCSGWVDQTSGEAEGIPQQSVGQEAAPSLR